MSKNICLGFASEAEYQQFVDNPMLFRDFLNTTYQQFPELFPQDWGLGFRFHDIYRSKKTDFFIRRVKLSSSVEVFSIRPSFLMPDLTGRTDEVEKALYLCQFGVPLSALVYVFGRDQMYWYRLLLQFGRPSLVGTTVKSKEKLPKHLAVDEKHAWLNGKKVYVPTTVSGGVFLGATVVEKADGEHPEKGYGEFKEEAAEPDSEYSPATVCTDDFAATRLA